MREGSNILKQKCTLIRVFSSAELYLSSPIQMLVYCNICSFIRRAIFDWFEMLIANCDTLCSCRVLNVI